MCKEKKNTENWIDVIKWMANTSENHRWANNIDGIDVLPYSYKSNEPFLQFNESGKLIAGSQSVYRDFLQSAIEGVNEIEEWEITQTRSNVSACEITKSGKWWKYKHFERNVELSNSAKESALKYIYDQEEIKCLKK